MVNYYSILELPDFASDQEIKTAYRKLAKRYHPDANGGDTLFEERFKQVQAAYEVLSDPLRKMVHDARLREPELYDNIDTQATGTKEYKPTQQGKTSGYGWLGGFGFILLVKLILSTFTEYSNKDKFYVNNFTVTTNRDTLSGGNAFHEWKTKETAREAQLIRTFTLRDGQGDVIKSQGLPDKVFPAAKRLDGTWKYGLSTVTFQGGRVTSYNNAGNNLRAVCSISDSSITASKHFSIGDHRDVVLKLQGQPTAAHIVSDNEEIWHYSGSAVSFRNEKVVAYTNSDFNLHVRR